MITNLRKIISDKNDEIIKNKESFVEEKSLIAE